MKVVYDALLQAYLDENGNVVEGVKEVDIEDNKGGVNFKQPFEATVNQDVVLKDVQQKAISTERAIVNFKNQLKALEQTKKELTDRLLVMMQQQNINKIELGDVTITRKKAYEKHTINTARLKEEMPDIAKLYDQVSNVGESVSIKIGGTKNED